MVWKRVAPWAMILVSALAFAASGCGSSMKDGTDSIETIMSVKEEYWDYLDSLNGHRSVDEQLRVIAENRSQWCSDLEYAGELCQYAVADDTEGAAAQLEQSLNVYSSHLGESG